MAQRCGLPRRRPELFHPASTRPTLARRQAAEALTVCARCPVRVECGADRPENAGGVWGGVWHPDPWQHHKYRDEQPNPRVAREVPSEEEIRAHAAATADPAALVAAVSRRAHRAAS
ncbi:MAG TPA: WhiB family transcriptional regulator [Pseudonocardiaceae bacterium]|nr:WhiB family transcriptional regulator [Pseudonocardiaceae bacterium]